MQRVIVQVPVDKEVKDKATKVAKELGFSSLQEAIRVILSKLVKKEVTLKVEEVKK